MKILFVTHHYLNGVGGGVFATRGYINAFAENCDEMHVLYPYKQGADPEEISEGVNLIPVTFHVPKWRKFVHLLKGKLHRFYNVFEKEIKRISPDVVVFDNSKCSDCLIDVAHRYNAKVITIHHNYEYEYNRDNLYGLMKHITLFWIKRIEGYSIRNSDLNLVLTKEDKKLLEDNYLNSNEQNNITLIGCFEYKKNKAVQQIKKTETNRQQFIITGNLGAVQTNESLKEWLNKYYPILKELLPNSTLVIAGKSPTNETKQFCNKNGIILYDTPKDMLPILQEANYYICPTSLGGGLKLRIMDGLKNGLQVITHKVSARGYSIFEETGALHSYDDEETFKKCIEKTIASNISKEHIIEIYKEYFSFETGVKNVCRLLGEI